MTHTPMQEIKTITSVKRARSSANGNPAFVVTFTDGTEARTGTDSAVGYEIANPEYRGVPLAVTFTKAGRIVGVRAA